MNNRKSAENQHPQQSHQPANHAPHRLPWGALEQQVVRMQKQIAQASQRGDRQAMYSLQQRLMESEAARLLAVRRVAEENQGRDTAGVDGIKSLTAEQQIAMAAAIAPRNWNHQPPLPSRRVWIAKPGTNERRPLAILPMIDRCKQALVKLALEPEWEARFEAHSYGYRPGRGAHDAIAAILVAIDHRPMFVFDADIEGAFDHVNHAAVLEKLQTYPALREAITAWLKAGVIDGRAYVPGETGIPQGGVLSPLLMNVALHGMEAVVAQGSTREAPLLVRYADDFVILHADLNELQQAIRRVRHWLAVMGLHLHAGKTRITHTLTPYQGQVGFDFLGFNIRQESGAKQPAGKREQAVTGAPANMRPGRSDGPGRRQAAPLPTTMGTTAVRTIVSPTQEASKRHLASIDQKLQQLQTASQARVIEELNPLIIGWAAYYNGVAPAVTMSRYDDLLEQRLLAWAGKRHPGKARDWLLNRYWQHTREVGEHKRVFATPNGVQLRAYRQMSILRR